MSERRLTRIEDKIDKIVDKIGSIDVTLVKQEEQLREHIKRTEILEAKLEPVEKHVYMVSLILKALGGSSVVGALCHSILHYLMKVY